MAQKQYAFFEEIDMISVQAPKDNPNAHNEISV